MEIIRKTPRNRPTKGALYAGIKQSLNSYSSDTSPASCGALDTTDRAEDHVQEAAVLESMVRKEVIIYTEEIASLTCSISDPLEYWRSSKIRLPLLAGVAKVCFTLPASSCAPERLFSTAGWMNSKLRRRLSAKKLRNMLTLRYSLKELKTIVRCPAKTTGNVEEPLDGDAAAFAEYADAEASRDDDSATEPTHNEESIVGDISDLSD